MTVKKQVAGFILTPETLNHPERMDSYIQTMAEHGCFLVDIFVRNMNCNLRTGGKVLHDCIARLVEKIHDSGMKCILDTDVYFWGNSLCEENPDSCQILCRNERVVARNGKFSFFSRRPSVKEQALFDRIEAVFQVKEDGTFVRIPDPEYQYEWENSSGFRIEGVFSDRRSGEFIFTVGTRAFHDPDLSHECFVPAMKRILDSLRDIPLDGFGWDEPGKGNGSMEFFRTGRAFFERFRKNRGYDLLDKMPYLDRADDTPEAVRVRCDYFSELNSVNFETQKTHNDYAKTIYNRELFFGTHPTWSGLPTDLSAGVADYFKLSTVLSAAWTDGSWTVDLRYYAFHLMLADGIRNELGFDDAYYNDWANQSPFVEGMHFATRFRMLFRVNWFNIFYSDFSEGIVNYRLPVSKREARTDMENSNRFSSLTNGLHARAEAAVLYTWEGLAAAPKWLTRAHYAAIGNTAHTLLDSGYAGSFISSESIRHGTSENGVLRCGTQKFKVLILPNCYALAEDVFEKILLFARNGVTVIVTGVPPMKTPEGAKLDYLSKAGVKPFSFAEYRDAFEEKTGLPSSGEWEKEYYDFNFPAEPEGEAEIIRNRSDEIICAGKNNLYFMTEFDPCESLAAVLRNRISLPCEAYCDHAYFRIFESGDASSKVVLCAAYGRMADASMVPSRLRGDVYGTRRKEGFLRCLIRIDGLELKAEGGTWCAFRIEKGRVAEVIGDCSTSYHTLN